LIKGSKSYFPRLKRRRWTSSTSTSSADFSDFHQEKERIDIMSSDPEKNKQSIMLNSDLWCMEGDSASPCVTLGAGPSPCSWCCPLQLGSPRGHWSGGITESLWPRELWIGSKDSNPKAEVPGDVVRRSKQQSRRRQRLRWRRRPRHSWLGRRPLATTTLRLRHARCTEQRLKGSLRVTPRVRRGCFGGDPRGRLLRAACNGRNEKGGSVVIARHRRRIVRFPRGSQSHSELHVSGFPTPSSGAWVYAVKPELGLLLLHHLRSFSSNNIIQKLHEDQTNNPSLMEYHYRLQNPKIKIKT